MTNGLPAGRVESCDGDGLQAALLAATAWVEQDVERINALNVFPVPDGDTGSNMWLTLQSAASEAAELGSGSSAGAVARAASHGALMGARGNSGVILSQILRGIARGLDDKPTFTAPELASALTEGATTAYRAVIKPVEGTILTVARESAVAAEEAARADSDLVATLRRTVNAANASLARTPSLLPVLAEAGVVDAGGQGYVAFIEGLLRFFSGESTAVGQIRQQTPGPRMVVEEPYGYCTEFMIQGEMLDVESVRGQMVAQGESVLVVGDESIIRVHLHTFDPGAVLTAAVRHGTLHKVKIDNMQEQHREFLLTGQLEPTPLPAIADRRPSVPEPLATVNDVALVAVVSGSGLTEVFRSLGATSVVPGGQTMNPSIGELLNAVNEAPAPAVILLPNNSNIVLTAEQVLPLSQKRLAVIPTKTIPQGVAALMAYNWEADFEANATAMAKASTSVKSLEVTRAVRDASADGISVKAGDAIAVVDGRLVTTGSTLLEVALTALAHAGVEHAELVTIYFGDEASREDAESVGKEIQSRWSACSVEVVPGGQPHYPYIISVE